MGTDRDDINIEFPTAMERIEKKVEEKGEQWVLDNYEAEFHALKRIMDVPNKEELPFYEGNER